MAKHTTPSWSQVKAELKHWDKTQLTGLIQNLFCHSQGNRDFLVARLLKDSIGEQALAPYIKRIESAFYNEEGRPAKRLNLRDARASIREYKRATSDPAGTLELMLNHVETGTEFTCEFGDIDEAFYLCQPVHNAGRDKEAAYPRRRPPAICAGEGPTGQIGHSVQDDRLGLRRLRRRRGGGA